VKREDGQKDHTGLIIILAVGAVSLLLCCVGSAVLFGVGA